MSNLRTATIRLAYENPSLRPHLLPLLKEAGDQDKVRVVNEKGRVVWVKKDTLRDEPGKYKPYKEQAEDEDSAKHQSRVTDVFNLIESKAKKSWDSLDDKEKQAVYSQEITDKDRESLSKQLKVPKKVVDKMKTYEDIRQLGQRLNRAK